MRFFRRHSFSCHVPYRTASSKPGLDLRRRAWDPAMLLDGADRCVYIDGHAREVLIGERLLLPDDGVVYLGWRLSRWLMSIPDDDSLTGARALLAGRARVFEAHAMHIPGPVPGLAGALLSVTLRSNDLESRDEDRNGPVMRPGPSARFPSLA